MMFWQLSWLELFYVILFCLPILLPGRILPIEQHLYILIAPFLFWPIDWLYQRLGNKSTAKRASIAQTSNPLLLSCICLLACFPLSLWTSVDRATSFSTAGYALWGIAFYHALIHWPLAHSKPRLFTWIFLGGGSLLCIAVLPIVYWKAEFRLFRLPLYDQFRSLHLDIGETIHANVLASVIAILLPLLFALMLRPSMKRFQRPGATLLFLALLIVLILTQSRGAYLAMLVALPLVTVLRWPRLLYATPLLLILAAGVVLRLGLSNVLDLLSTDGSLGGWAGRMDIWTQSVNAIYDFPFTGIGFGTFTTVIPLLYPLQVSIEGYPHAHNLFLQIGVDLGVGGLVAYCAILFSLFGMLWRTLRAFPRQSYEWTLAVGALGSLVAVLVHGLLDAAIWVSKIAFFPWILFALITLLFLKAEESKRELANGRDQ